MQKFAFFYTSPCPKQHPKIYLLITFCKAFRFHVHEDKYFHDNILVYSWA